MKTGYDDFFKKARAKAGVSQAPNVKRPAPAMASRRRAKKSRSFAWSTVIVCVVGSVATGWAFLYADQIEKFLQTVEVSWMSPALAEDAAPRAAGPVASAPEAAPKELTADEVNHLSKLTQRSRELDAREEEIARQEAELEKLKAELEVRLKELADTRGKISEILADRVKVDEEKIDTLVQVYTNMKPQQAAAVFEAMDIDLAVQILSKMKKKNAADIMNLIKPEKAQLFSEKYAGYVRAPASDSGKSR